jgi:hypothetical protein
MEISQALGRVIEHEIFYCSAEATAPFKDIRSPQGSEIPFLQLASGNLAIARLSLHKN